MRRYGHAVLGGTFDHLHVGHAALLDTAFRVGRRVSIGLTTDRFLAQFPKPLADRLQPFAVRRRVLHRWLRRRYPRRAWRTVPLENRFGGSVEGDVDVLVVSADTRAGGDAVNAERVRRGRRRVPLVIVPVVLADDLAPVSSRRVRAGTIDANGRRRAPVTVTISASGALDLATTRSAVERAFAAPRITVGPRPSKVDGGPGDGGGTAPPLGAPSSSPEIEVTVRRARQGGWSIAERAGPIEIAAPHVPEGPPAHLRRAVLHLLRPDLERKTYPSERTSRRRWRPT